MIDLIPLPLLEALVGLPGWVIRLFLDLLIGGFVFSSLWAAYYCFRRAFGHRRYRGVWYSRASWEVLVQELYDGVRAGRVPDWETMEILDKYVYGKRSALRSLSRRDAI